MVASSSSGGGGGPIPPHSRTTRTSSDARDIFEASDFALFPDQSPAVVHANLASNSSNVVAVAGNSNGSVGDFATVFDFAPSASSSSSTSSSSVLVSSAFSTAPTNTFPIQTGMAGGGNVLVGSGSGIIKSGLPSVVSGIPTVSPQPSFLDDPFAHLLSNPGKH